MPAASRTRFHFARRPPRTCAAARVGRILLCAALVAGLAAVEGAAQSQESPLTLSQAVALAEREDPGLAAAQARARAAERRAVAAGRFWLPEVGFDLGWESTDVPARVFAQKLNRREFTAEDFLLDNLNHPEADANLESSLGLRLPVDLFGQAKARAAGSRAAAEVERARTTGAGAELRFAVTQVFFQILATDRFVAAAEASLRLAQGLERDAQARRDFGAALAADLLRTRTRRRDREVELERRRSRSELLRSRLRALIAWPPERPVSLQAPEAASPEPKGLLRWQEDALAHHPRMLEAAAAARAAEANLLGHRRSAFPSLETHASYQDDRSKLSDGGQGGSVGLSLRWSLFDSGRKARTEAAREDYEGARAAQREAETATRLEVEQRWRELGVARLELQAASEAESEAQEVFRVSRERWKAGQGTLTDLLDAENALASALEGVARSETSVAVGDAALRQAAGSL
jgi:outer membrane protein TolC